MKRFFLVLLAVVLCGAFVACGATNAEPTVAETVAETTAPFIDTPVDEPEWTLYEGELKLMSGDTTLAEGDDFLYFAIVGADVAEMELRFKLSEDAASNLLTAETSDLNVTFNGENIGKASLSDDGSVVTIASTDATEVITELATKIRGL